eukprot:10735965-Ditylum_brightwellii.AAC.1
MLVLPFLLGFPLQRWQTATDIMLKKDPGSPKISQLHIILIVEGNVNAIMKVIWNRQLVPVAEKTRFNSPVQFGNRKDALLLKVVTMEVTSIHLQSSGLPEEAVKCSVLLNHNMRCHVKTTA